ncbi:alpha-ketoglutarate-dependent dioxygenase AlkB [Adhaeretor mobilis]|uniref:Fe2OG dioxygenase domain-containing protein n=1 Tax=Adhaeretor mobilis TaxID=1930276 RepID=A0A517N374_9BACT|nr:alpha-ketoglutarate-dependent dioxygenase AlkB [Adhaeretor mobilis]QDT01592.1 hypothetical protein HG15A2_49390 [Adhaeretor mobilis]
MPEWTAYQRRSRQVPRERTDMKRLATHDLGDGHFVSTCLLPEELWFSAADFEALWQLRPAEFPEIFLHGRTVKLPRWQQTFGEDYHYSGKTMPALPVPELLTPLVRWCQQNIHDQLNALLLNWYDGALGHYIGAHRDSTKHMFEGAPIVTVSLGEERTFRLRPWRGKGTFDLPVPNHSVLVMPFETNRAWTHEVPRFNRHQGKRISVTLRALGTGLGDC